MAVLYMEIHIPRAVTNGLRQRGVDVITAQEDDTATLEDPDLLDSATTLRRALYTQDDDLLAEAHRRQIENILFAGVVYSHQLNITVGQRIEDLELIAKATEADEWFNHVEYLPLK
jgi:predicted nuclease of predicted toxin-antitoxin system